MPDPSRASPRPTRTRRSRRAASARARVLGQRGAQQAARGCAAEPSAEERSVGDWSEGSGSRQRSRTRSDSAARKSAGAIAAPIPHRGRHAAKPTRPPKTPGPAVTIEPRAVSQPSAPPRPSIPTATRPRRRSPRQRRPCPTTRPKQDHCGRDDCADRDDRSQPRVPARSTGKQSRRPDRGDDDRGGADGVREERLAVLPHEMRADADERGDRGRERDRVVLVEDPLHQAEHNRGDDEPAAPHDDRGRVESVRGAPQHPQPAT